MTHLWSIVFLLKRIVCKAYSQCHSELIFLKQNYTDTNIKCLVVRVGLEQISKYTLQWRVQDFPESGAHLQRPGCQASILSTPSPPPRTAWKWKKLPWDFRDWERGSSWKVRQVLHETRDNPFITNTSHSLRFRGIVLVDSHFLFCFIIHQSQW